MKIGIAQLELMSGDVDYNIKKHIKAINLATKLKLEALFFSELSLTHYEPQLAEALQMDYLDNVLDVFQSLSDEGDLIIGVGAPIKALRGIEISMIIFQPHLPRIKYAKQLLHVDEVPFFSPGNEQVLIDCKGLNITPAICYESTQIECVESAIHMNTDVYLSSVAKTGSGIKLATTCFSKFSKEYSIPILMVNAIGKCDDFICGGRSAIWSKNGVLLGQFDSVEEGLLVYDNKMESIEKYHL